MMEAIIILMMIAIFFINFIFIDKIYRIVDCQPVKAKKLNKKNSNFSIKEALIIGDDAKCKNISDMLISNNISTDLLNNIDDIDKLYPYKYVLAAFDDDLENLTACIIAINIMEIKNTFSICNKTYNKKIYDENNIICFNNCASASDIVLVIMNYQHKTEV